MAISFTIIIPTLHEEKRIGPLLESLKRQKFRGKFEVLVCDGGSNDRTREIVARYPFARFLSCGRGVSRQRNVGAKIARGQLLIFMDADDIAPPRFLHNVWKSYKRMPFSVACPWLFAHDGGPLTRVFYFLFNLGFWAGQSTLRMGSGVCLIVRRRDFWRGGGFDERLHLGEDVKLIRSLSPRCGMHRHLLVPLGTSGRRFEERGSWKLMAFYARITPLLFLGAWGALKKIPYPAAPYRTTPKRI